MDQGQQFPTLYHGTTAELKPGNKIQPSSQTGVSIHGDTNAERGQPASQFAHATSDEETAWAFAGKANSSPYREGGEDIGRTRVYEVKPHTETRKGYETWHDEYIAPSFEVVGEIPTRPGPKGDPRGQQGTLPANWRKFTSSYSSPPDDQINHPHPDTVAEQTSGELMNWHEINHDNGPKWGFHRDEFESSARGHHAGQTRLF